jgi:hypothetical protein
VEYDMPYIQEVHGSDTEVDMPPIVDFGSGIKAFITRSYSKKLKGYASHQTVA